MKRTVSVFICICAFLALSAGSVWAEWEGNAGMASAGDFPSSGMYARSDMFPRNTIVEIRNLETEITVRAVITGTSGVPGLVAVLSPLTASALQIRSGSVSRVRISIPSPVSERPAPGTVTSGTGTETADPDVNPAVAASRAAGSAASGVPAAAAVPAGTAVPLASVAKSSENPLVPLAPPVAVVSEPSAPEAPAAAVFDAEPSEPAMPAATALIAAEPAEPAEAVEAAETVASAEPEPIPEGVIDAIGEVPAESAVAVAPAVSPVFFDEPALESASVSDDGTIVDSAEAEPAAAAPVPEIAGLPPASAEAVLFAATLEPAEPNPPEASEDPVPQSFPDAPPVAVAVPSSPQAAPVPAVAPEPAVPASPAIAAAPVNLPYISALAKGSYYIQIATYSDPLNALKLVDSYGKKYPVAVERSAAKGGEILKICIGPVKKDEYGAVLERFKTLGYKDAFVRKGQ